MRSSVSVFFLSQPTELYLPIAVMAGQLVNCRAGDYHRRLIGRGNTLTGRAMLKKIVLAIGVCLVIILATYAALVTSNNIGAEPPDRAGIAASLEQSLSWIDANRDQLLRQNNPMLWWMIRRAAETSGDVRLQLIYRDYLNRFIRSQPYSPWRPLFDAGLVSLERSLTVEALPDYNQYIIYGLTCDQTLGQTHTIQQQMATGFCRRHHPISPACVTHQMMGLYFRQQSQCGDIDTLERQMGDLQDRVVSQLTWDPRVVDIYLQRVLMLVQTGAGIRVEARWLQRILNAQLPDGSWSDFSPAIPLGGGRAIGFDARGFAVSQTTGGFHTTAQGALLMSLLLAQ